MTEETFRGFLSRHYAVFMKYKNEDRAGSVNVWFYNGNFILSWEECREGDQWNESNYSRDELHTFPDIDSAIRYLKMAGLDIEQFAV